MNYITCALPALPDQGDLFASIPGRQIEPHGWAIRDAPYPTTSGTYTLRADRVDDSADVRSAVPDSETAATRCVALIFLYSFLHFHAARYGFLVPPECARGALPVRQAHRPKPRRAISPIRIGRCRAAAPSTHWASPCRIVVASRMRVCLTRQQPTVLHTQASGRLRVENTRANGTYYDDRNNPDMCTLQFRVSHSGSGVNTPAQAAGWRPAGRRPRPGLRGTAERRRPSRRARAPPEAETRPPGAAADPHAPLRPCRSAGRGRRRTAGCTRSDKPPPLPLAPRGRADRAPAWWFPREACVLCRANRPRPRLPLGPACSG
jgi:hypothetical protein